MNQEDKILYNIAAMLYNSQSNNIKRDNVLKKIIESILVVNANKTFTCTELSVEINKKVHMIVVEDEIMEIITNKKNHGFALDYYSHEIKVNLKKDRYEYIMNQNKRNIEAYVKEFVQIKSYSEEVQGLIERFLYDFYCRNVNELGRMIGEPSNMHVEDFPPDEAQIIQEFIDWDNDDKNELLLAVANYALEYLLISGNNGLKDKRDLRAVFANKNLYIDTNVLFYCLGVNGPIHEESNKAFLKKCKDCGEHIIISYYTDKEFNDTLDHFISEIDRLSTPLIYNPKINAYVSNLDVYNYYIAWANKRHELRDAKYFKKFLLDKYDKLIEEFSILLEKTEPFTDEELENDEIFQSYERSIPSKSGTNYDAKNIFFVESKRTAHETDLQKANAVFISAHKDLQRWDGERERSTAPIVVAPNLWLVLLARLISRSDDDLKCFISYINLANREVVISNKEYFEVVKIIHDIIEDIEQQESVLAVMVDEEFAFLNNGGEKRSSSFIEERTTEKAYSILKMQILSLEKDVEKYKKRVDSVDKTNQDLKSMVKEQNKELLEKSQILREVEQLNEKQRNDNYAEYNALVEENRNLKENLNRWEKGIKIGFLSLLLAIINIFTICEFTDIFIIKNPNPLTYPYI